MLTKVDISNYRCFKTFKMEDLTRVNLLVGRNNSGKTAILEGVQFLTSGGDPSVLAEVAQRRGEVIVGRPDVPQTTLVDIGHFFYGHALALDSTFSFAGDNGYPQVSVKAFAQKNGKSESPEARPVRTEIPGFFLRFVGPANVEQERGNKVFRISRDGGVDLDVPRLRRLGVRPPAGPQMHFIGPDSLSSHQMARMWDEVTWSGQETSIADAMRVLDSNLESVHFLTGALASGYAPSRSGIVVGTKGQAGRVPLGSMGDGVRRLMALATALAFTKGGCLFIDEIDTGLHYRVMADMWRLVVNKAVESDIQVFATTHSWDCIVGMSELCQQHPDLKSLVSIHRIDRELERNVAFSGESIVKMTKSDIDPR